VDADVRRVASFARDFMFAEPVINSIVKQDATAVRVDVNAVVVRPKCAGVKGFFCRRVHVAG
jgi:hypothetical protein